MTSSERNLRSLAAQAGYASLYALSRAAGVDRECLARLLRPGGRVTPRTRERVAAALGVSVETLLRALRSVAAA